MTTFMEPRLLKLNLNLVFTSKISYAPAPLYIHNLKLPKSPSNSSALILTLNSLSTATCCFAADHSPSLLDDSGSNPVALTAPERTRDRRKVVRVAWEKLVRWSRSWRSKAKTDVLERTNKVNSVTKTSNLGPNLEYPLFI